MTGVLSLGQMNQLLLLSRKTYRFTSQFTSPTGLQLSLEYLRIIQTRLSLALSNLPTEPEQASKDLETAWNELDKLLIIATFPEEAQDVILSTVPTNEENVEDATKTSEDIEGTPTPEAKDDN